MDRAADASIVALVLGVAAVMYRGSRLAACLLLILTGSAALAIAAFVVPPAVGNGAARWLIPGAIAMALSHFVALVGVARGRDWGRALAVFIGELGGGLSILGAVAVLVGARPIGAASTLGFVAWSGVVYALLAIAAGRVPVLARLTPLERRRVVLGPSFAGLAG